MKKRILAMLLLVCTLVMTFAGCSSAMYEYDVYADYILLGSLEGVTIDQSDIDDAITDAYRALFTSDDKLETKEYTSKDTEILVIHGDTLTIDYVGTMDGKTFDGGSANDSSLTIGSGQFIDGFEDGLKGHGAGETVVLDLTFPADYSKAEYAGKAVRFTVTIDKIKRTVYPEYNDENVKKYSKDEFKTVAEFEEDCKGDIIKNLLWNEYYLTCKVKKYPEKELTDYYNSSIDSIKATAAMFGMTVSSFVTSYYGYSDIKSYYKSVAASAQSAVKNDLIILALVEKMPEIVLSEADYEQALVDLHKEQVEENGYEGSYKQFIKDYEATALKISVYSDIILDMLDEKKVIYDDVTRNGFFSDRNGMRYYVNGEFVKGWQKLDLDGKGEKDYYFDVETGYAPDSCAKVLPQGAVEGEEKYLEFGENGLYIGLYNGIYKDGTGTRYFKDGVMQTGTINLELNESIEGEETYYFNVNTGYMAIGIAVGPDGLYHDFGEDGQDKGIVPNGLVSDKTGTRYFVDGMFLTGWIEDKIDADNDGNYEKYYFDTETGYMYVNSAFEIEDKYYTFDKDGVCQGISDGLLTDDNGTRLFKEGVLQLGLQEYTTTNDATNTYFFKPDKGYALVSDWYTEEVDGETVNKYYFDENGYKVVNKTIKIGGKDYKFDENGNVVEG